MFYWEWSMNIFLVLWRIRIRGTGEVIGWLTPPIFGATNYFFPPISAISLPQFFFPLYFDNAIATNQLPQIFSPLHFCNVIATIFFSSHFQQLGYYNSYFLSPPFPTISATWPQLVSLWALHLALALWALHTHLGSSFGQKEFR